MNRISENRRRAALTALAACAFFFFFRPGIAHAHTGAAGPIMSGLFNMSPTWVIQLIIGLCLAAPARKMFLVGFAVASTVAASILLFTSSDSGIGDALVWWGPCLVLAAPVSIHFATHGRTMFALLNILGFGIAWPAIVLLLVRL
jgi:hypothetical protein